MTQMPALRISPSELEGARWHKSSWSVSNNGCLEQDFVTAVRNGAV